MNHATHNTNHATRNTQYDIYLVGVGGQGVLTIGELVAETAHCEGIPVNFYPTKGMAQRGGFVKAQLRLGREPVGANAPQNGADLSLKGIRFLKPGADFLLFGHVWPPTDVMLGKGHYPTLEQVREQVQEAGGKMHYLAPDSLPLYEGVPVAANVFVLGAAVGCTGLGDVLDPAAVARVVEARWKRGVERNRFAFRSGMDAVASHS
jgi:indolepyruvate ferredoxin oxidoreductase beta subunit